MSSQWGTTGGNLTDFIWQYISQTATLYNWILKIETETKFATLLLKERKNWTLSQYWKLNFIINEYKNFSFESPMGNNRWELDQLHLTTHFFISRTATLIPTTKRAKRFLFKNASKNAPKMPQKCNFYFKRLLKCFKIDSKMPHDS